MSLHKITQKMEIKFWDAVIPCLKDDGFLMNGIKRFYDFLHTKAGYLCLMILLWSAIGFVSGLILGRIIGFYYPF